MKKLLTFKDYLTDKILENMDLKITDLELVLSPKLVKILKEMNHKIADELLEIHLDDKPNYKITFVDLGSTADMVSFIQSNKVPSLIEPDIVHDTYTKEVDKEKGYNGGYFDYKPSRKNPWISDFYHLPDLFDNQFKSKEHPVWNKYRAEISVGKFVVKVFGKKFAANMKREELAKLTKPEDVESFVNMFIATVEKHSKTFKIVSGNDISYWYDCNRYFKDGGTLGGSCMKSKRGVFDIYTENSDKIQLLVLFPEEIRDKIIGRAIVWKLDEPEGRYFMDRIYTNNDSDEYLFIEYAKKQGWLYKSSQSYGWDYNIIDTKTSKSEKVRLVVNIPPVDYDKYPYLDTFQFYNPDTGLLTNDYNGEVRNDRENFKQLTNADGGYNRP